MPKTNPFLRDFAHRFDEALDAKEREWYRFKPLFNRAKSLTGRTTVYQDRIIDIACEVLEQMRGEEDFT